jgi:uncharacterized membrane protein YkgB
MQMNFLDIDRSIANFMQKWSIGALRFALATIYIWFGILKPLGLSPTDPLVEATIRQFPLLNPDRWVSIIGWWEVAIGVAFIFRKTIRIGILLLVLQMGGAFLPLFLFPHVTFQTGHLPYAPTLEGQYIIKNLLVLAAAMTIGGAVKRSNTEKKE